MGRPPSPHWDTISYKALLRCASTGPCVHLHFHWDSRKGKLSGSGLLLNHKRYCNLVYVRRSSSLSRPPAPHWATISNIALLRCASTGPCDAFHFRWDSRKGKSTGSDHLYNHKRYYNLVCVRRRSDLGRPPAPHWAATSYNALLPCASTGASAQLHFH